MKTWTKTVIALAFGLSTSALADDELGYNIGDAVADFSLKNVDGQQVQLSDYKDRKGVIVVFTCNHCPFAKMWEDRIIDLHQKYAAKGFPVVAVNPNPNHEGDRFADMQARAEKKKYGFPYLIDETQGVSKSFGASRTPHVFILENMGGEFKVAYIGAIDNNYKDPKAVSERYVEDAVNSLLAGKRPKVDMTKSVGCGIKWEE
ncbi:MAG: thioredoxin family protein [Cytophagales bacterium]|nr:thioredoxin family protein [Cytophagales bacterium]